MFLLLLSQTSNRVINQSTSQPAESVAWQKRDARTRSSARLKCSSSSPHGFYVFGRLFVRCPLFAGLERERERKTCCAPLYNTIEVEVAIQYNTKRGGVGIKGRQKTDNATMTTMVSEKGKRQTDKEL